MAGIFFLKEIGFKEFAILDSAVHKTEPQLFPSLLKKR